MLRAHARPQTHMRALGKHAFTFNMTVINGDLWGSPHPRTPPRFENVFAAPLSDNRLISFGGGMQFSCKLTRRWRQKLKFGIRNGHNKYREGGER